MSQKVRFYVVHFILGLVLIVFQSTLLAKLGGLDFLPVLVIHLGAGSAFISSAIVILLLGLAQDLFSGAMTGLHSCLYLLIFFGAYLINRAVHLGETFQRMAAVCVALVLLHLVLSQAVGGGHSSGRQWLNIGVTTIVSPFLFQLFSLAESWQLRIMQIRSVD